MKRFVIFALLFPPLAMLLFQAPDMVSKRIPPSEVWLAWVIASYPIAIIPALLMAWIDEKLSTHPVHLLKTTASGGLMSAAVLVFLGGIPGFWPMAMATLLGALPTAICSWLSDRSMRSVRGC